MSLALRWEDTDGGGFVYLDSVTLYSQDHSGKVTSHPIDVGSNVSDHYFKNNPKYKITAVVSGVDISTGTYLIQDTAGNVPYNAIPAPSAVNVSSTDSSVLKKFIPDSLGQFLSDSTPEVSTDLGRTDLIDQIREMLISLTSGELLNRDTGEFNPNIRLVDLYEYDGYKLNRVINRLVLTNLNFRETPDTGYALYCDFSFEQISFASLKKTQIPKDVQASIKKKTDSKVSKGKQDSTVQDPASNEKVDTDPLRQARE
nr:MAG TPA: hypothetical protein [Caudoviricetes sp.]